MLYVLFSHEGHHKCREQWPDNALEYERAFNLFLDAILLIFPLIMLSTAYFSITKTLWQGMALERSTKRYAKSTGNNNYQNACKYKTTPMLVCVYVCARYFFLFIFPRNFKTKATASNAAFGNSRNCAVLFQPNHFCTQSISEVLNNLKQ